MSVSFRKAIEENMKWLETVTTAAVRTKEDVRAEINELESSMKAIKSDLVKKTIKEKLETLQAEYDAPEKDDPYRTERQSLLQIKQGLSVVLDAMAHNTLYKDGLPRGRTGAVKKVAKVAKTGPKRKYTRRAQ